VAEWPWRPDPPRNGRFSIFAYNHNDAYVDQVWQLAVTYGIVVTRVGRHRLALRVGYRDGTQPD
jgi:hypothetical protein